MVVLVDRAKGVLAHAERIERALASARRVLVNATWMPQELVRLWLPRTGLSTTEVAPAYKGTRTGKLAAAIDKSQLPGAHSSTNALGSPTLGRKSKPRRRRKSQYEEMLGLASVFDQA